MDRKTFIENIMKEPVIKDSSYDGDLEYCFSENESEILNKFCSEDRFNTVLRSKALKNWLKKYNIGPDKMREIETNLDIDYYALDSENKFIMNLRFNPNELYDRICDLSEKILIYRVENENGNGAYNGIKINSYSDNNPSPFEDENIKNIFQRGKDDYFKRYKFAFKKVEDVFRWFGQDNLKKIKEKGFNISVYEVPKNLIITSRHQVCFKEESGRILKRMPIMEGGRKSKHKIK